MSAAQQLHQAAAWFLEEGTVDARENLAAASSRYEVEGSELETLVREAVAERDARVGTDGLPVSEWHARARKALA